MGISKTRTKTEEKQLSKANLKPRMIFVSGILHFNAVCSPATTFFQKFGKKNVIKDAVHEVSKGYPQWVRHKIEARLKADETLTKFCPTFASPRNYQFPVV